MKRANILDVPAEKSQYAGHMYGTIQTLLLRINLKLFLFNYSCFSILYSVCKHLEVKGVGIQV